MNNILLMACSVIIISLIVLFGVQSSKIKQLDQVILKQNTAIVAAQKIAQMEKENTEKQIDIIRQQYKRAQEKPKPPKEFFESCDQAIAWLAQQGKSIRDGQ